MNHQQETLDQIQQFSNERLSLWRLAGHKQLSVDQQRRIGELIDKLYQLWDQHRRELAARNRSNPTRRDQNIWAA